MHILTQRLLLPLVALVLVGLVVFLLGIAADLSVGRAYALGVLAIFAASILTAYAITEARRKQ